MRSTKLPKLSERARGRPEAPDRVTVQARVTEAERTAFEARAQQLHLSVSEWLRLLARRDAGLWTPTAEPLERDE